MLLLSLFVSVSLSGQETVVSSLGYDVPAEITTAYREALSLRPFMDDRFLAEVQEVRRVTSYL